MKSWNFAPARPIGLFRQTIRELAVILVLAVLPACACFNPRPIDQVPFKKRAQTQQHGEVIVTAAVPSADESKQLFGVPLVQKKIQPVWLRVENHDDVTSFLLPISLDPDYFSTQEAAWKMRIFLGGEVNRRMAEHFDKYAIDTEVSPGKTVEGFIHTNLDSGVKYFSVTLYSPGRTKFFDFMIEIPGLETDYQRVDWNRIEASTEIKHVSDEELRKVLEKLPCCVFGEDRKTPGDPLNIVVIGEGESIFMPFIRRRWHVTEVVSGSSIWRTVMSSLFNVRYRTSPISSLYLYGRSQDIALQKARDSVDERNHLRLWAVPLRYNGMEVWVGQISRDIGVRLSSKTLVTHKIDPDVDEARGYLLQDLLFSGGLAKVGFAGGVGKATRQAPRYNYTGDPYFTDGERYVFVLKPKSVTSDELQFFDWSEKAEHSRPYNDPGIAQSH